MGTQNAAPLRLADFRDLAAGHVTRPVRDFVVLTDVDTALTGTATPAAIDCSAVRP